MLSDILPDISIVCTHLPAGNNFYKDHFLRDNISVEFQRDRAHPIIWGTD